VSITIFENARLFDGISAEARDGTSVAVDGNEIKEISIGRIHAQYAERIDCRGKTLMPGMIDNHVHVYIESFNLNQPEPPITYRAQYAQRFLNHALLCGFTTVRDVGGGDHGMAMALRAGFVDGPRFYYGGLCLTQTGGHGDNRALMEPSEYCDCGGRRSSLSVRADGVDECIRATREELRKGAAHIKIMASGGVLSPADPLDRCQYSEAEIRAIVEECRRHGAYVCAHCHPAEAIRRCVQLGVRSIEHGTLIDDATAQLVAAAGAFVVPTISVVFALVQEGPKLGLTEASLEKLGKIHERALSSLETMRRASVKMGFGTDLLGPHHTRRGEEFTHRNKVLAPFDILRSATVINAEILQMGGRLGVIKEGALADLLLVDGDPLRNIELLAANGRYLTHIMLDGKFVKRLPS